MGSAKLRGRKDDEEATGVEEEGEGTVRPEGGGGWAPRGSLRSRVQPDPARGHQEPQSPPHPGDAPPPTRHSSEEPASTNPTSSEETSTLGLAPIEGTPTLPPQEGATLISDPFPLRGTPVSRSQRREPHPQPLPHQRDHWSSGWRRMRFTCEGCEPG